MEHWGFLGNFTTSSSCLRVLSGQHVSTCKINYIVSKLSFYLQMIGQLHLCIKVSHRTLPISDGLLSQALLNDKVDSVKATVQ